MIDEVQDNAPNLERLRHGPIERHVEVVVYDHDNRPSRAVAPKALGLVERMAQRGAISDEMAAAAERFRSDFHTSALEALRAAQMHERITSGLLQQDISYRALRARRRILEAVEAVGHPGGSCLWECIGLEKTLKEWSRFKMTPEAASGVLIGALGTLKAHYAGSKAA